LGAECRKKLLKMLFIITMFIFINPGSVFQNLEMTNVSVAGKINLNKKSWTLIMGQKREVRQRRL